MIFVVLAIGISFRPFFANKIRPDPASIRTAERAYNSDGFISVPLSPSASCACAVQDMKTTADMYVMRQKMRNKTAFILFFLICIQDTSSSRLIFTICIRLGE